MKIIKTTEYTVRGRVQGVGYRYHTRLAALSIGVRGYVCNEADGSVKVVAQGDDAAHRALRVALRQGSPWAKVEAIEEKPVLLEQDFPDFRIRY